MLKCNNIRVVQHLHYLQLSVLVALILKNLLNCNNFSSFSAFCLENNTERPCSYHTFSYVANNLPGLTISTTNSSFNNVSCFYTHTINYIWFAHPVIVKVHPVPQPHLKHFPSQPVKRTR
nr:Os05g0207600 [Ipomoea batatas]